MTGLEQQLTEVLASRSQDAPPAAGLVQAAQAHARRRRRNLRGGAAAALLAVLVPAGVVGHGLIRNQPSVPEPLGPFQYGLHQDISDAVPAAKAPGFHNLDYGVPSSNPPVLLSNGHTRLGPFQEYVDIDASGRLAAMRISSHQTTPSHLDATYQLVPGPGQPVRQLTAPVYDGQSDVWMPHFTSDGRLLWSPTPNIMQTPWIDDRLTNLAGGQLQRVVPPSTVALPSSRVFPSQRGLWVVGDRTYFSAVTKAEGPSRKHAWVSLFSFDPAHPGQVRHEAATNVSGIDVSNGEAVWIDASDTRVFAEDLATAKVHDVPVPLGSGCSLVPNADLGGGAFPDAVVTNGSVIALLEYCPDIRSTRELVVDLSGRLVTEFDPGHGNQIFEAVLSDQTIAFIVQADADDPSGNRDDRSTYLDDLGTGELVALGHQVPDFDNDPSVAGRYVLWYAGQHGHVGRLDPQ